MLQRPNAVGLLLCEKTIVEEGTRNVSLINHFTLIQARSVPTEPKPFTVYTVLTDGLGQGQFRFRITDVESQVDVYSRSVVMTFRDPLARLRLRLRVGECSFPAAGRYEVALEVDGETIAECILPVTPEED